jgi:phosphohistidine phosphatase
MRLMLLRHAKTEKAEPGMRDQERALNARGRSETPVIGAYMARHGLVPDRAIVSTARRTRETWGLLAAAWRAPPPVVFDDRLYDATPKTIIAVLQEAERMVRALLVIGHNPGLHDAARLLIASGDVEARERLNEGMPTAALAVIDFAGDNWRKLHSHGGRLERFVSPRSLEAAATEDRGRARDGR